MEYLIKHKRTYLMVAGTLLPAFVAKKIGDAMNLNESTQNVLFIAGLIAGGLLTAKMLKK
jgi:hypothetical protein